jgi:hypothetical protein
MYGGSMRSSTPVTSDEVSIDGNAARLETIAGFLASLFTRVEMNEVSGSKK